MKRIYSATNKYTEYSISDVERGASQSYWI